MKKNLIRTITLCVMVISMLILLAIITMTTAGCTEASRVGHNISNEADNFNVTRRLSVINMRSDKPLFELIGNFSISNSGYNELEVIVEVQKGVYKKHYIYLNDWTMYVVEDISGAYVSPYHYEISFLPEAITPIEFVTDTD